MEETRARMGIYPSSSGFPRWKNGRYPRIRKQVSVLGSGLRGAMDEKQAQALSLRVPVPLMPLRLGGGCWHLCAVFVLLAQFSVTFEKLLLACH